MKGSKLRKLKDMMEEDERRKKARLESLCTYPDTPVKEIERMLGLRLYHKNWYEWTESDVEDSRLILDHLGTIDCAPGLINMRLALRMHLFKDKLDCIPGIRDKAVKTWREMGLNKFIDYRVHPYADEYIQMVYDYAIDLMLYHLKDPNHDDECITRIIDEMMKYDSKKMSKIVFCGKAYEPVMRWYVMNEAYARSILFPPTSQST